VKIVEFAFPGPLRERLIAAILTGEKTATTALLLDYELDGEQLPRVGEPGSVVDSDGRPVAVIEYTEVTVVALGEVDLDTALDEGEGFASVAEWRVAHEEFWNGYIEELRERVGDPCWRLTDETPVIVHRFRLIG